LSEGLPNDETLARALVQQKIAEIGRSKLEDELRTAYLPLGTMMAYGLDRYPVIIFDKQAVIYGMTDLSLAINRYRQWLKDKNGGGN
jgi:integrating conjugative element protein (TIGR03757 family)